MTTKSVGKQKSPEEANEWPKVVEDGNIKVTVYRRMRANGTYGYEVADYSQGKRKLISAPTEEKAMAEAGRIVGMLGRGETTALEMDGKQRASYGRGIELIRPTGATLETVCDTYAKAYALVGDRILEAVRYFYDRDPSRLKQGTVAEVVNEMITEKSKRKKSNGKAALSDRYIQDLRSRLDRFAESFQCQIHSVQAQDIQEWLDKLGVAPQTRKNFRTVLGTLFAWAERRGYVAKGQNPTVGLEKIEADAGDSVVTYTPEEIERLLAATRSAAPKFLPCVVIGAFAGLRSAEIERLEWSNIDLARGFITLSAEKAKTAGRRVVPISENLKAWLGTCKNQKGRVWRGSHEDFYDAQQTVARATASGKGRKKIEPVTWKTNGLRHSYASYRLALVQSAAQVALEMGNSPAVVFAHYRELATPDQAKAWFAVSPNV